MHHSLLVARLVITEIVRPLVERLPDPGDIAVAEDTPAAGEEALLDPIAFDVLAREESHQRLCHREPHPGVRTVQPPTMNRPRIRIGTAPISWGACEIPNWGDQLPYAQVLDEMAASGYEGTELGPWSYLPSDPATLRRELDARKLSLVGAFCPVTLHDRDRSAASLQTARQTIDLLAAAGAPVLVLADAGDEQRAAIAGRVPADGSAGFSHGEWRRFSDGVNTVARYARERGLITAFHPHVASYVERPEEIARLMRDTDPTLVGLCLDTGHVAYGGGDPVEIARTHAQRVRHVHLKDVRREVRADALARQLDFRDAVSLGVFAPLGDGSLDLRSTLGALRAVGYAGWVIVEQDVRLGVSPIAAPLRDAKRSRAYLTEVLAG